MYFKIAENIFKIIARYKPAIYFPTCQGTGKIQYVVNYDPCGRNDYGYKECDHNIIWDFDKKKKEDIENEPSEQIPPY